MGFIRSRMLLESLYALKGYIERLSGIEEKLLTMISFQSFFAQPI